MLDRCAYLDDEAHSRTQLAVTVMDGSMYGLRPHLLGCTYTDIVKASHG